MQAIVRVSAGGRASRTQEKLHQTEIDSRKDDLMTPDPTMPFSIVKGIVDTFSGKGISLTTEKVSTAEHSCDSHQCAWKSREHTWVACRGTVPPFRGLLGARIVLVIAFEYNGCDINNARLRISDRSFNKWWNDSAKYVITATGGLSKIAGPTGCPECCVSSTCVEFDVDINIAFDWTSTDRISQVVRICGDGSVNIY
jgi:hypothetical protein